MPRANSFPLLDPNKFINRSVLWLDFYILSPFMTENLVGRRIFLWDCFWFLRGTVRMLDYENDVEYLRAFETIAAIRVG